MSTVIKLKKSETALSKPSTSDLVAGEVAINALDQRIFVRDSNSKIITIGEAGGKRHESAAVEHTVTVATKTNKHRYNGTGSSSGYKIDGSFSPTIELVPGNTYKFDQADSSNSGHPLRFYYEADKTTAFTTGVTTSGTPGNSGAYTQIVVADTTPSVLHYQCSNHGYMGNQVVIGTRNLTGLDTGDLGEGTNLYYTDARFDTRLGTKDTGDLSEGSNLYYTDARVLTKINATGIDALSDVDTTTASPSNGQALVWDGSQWEPGTVGGQITVQDEGSSLSTSASTINFVGSGVVASGTGSTKTITISGGGGGGGIALSDISVGSEATAAGDGGLAYNNTSGVFTYTPPTLSGIGGTTDNVTEGSSNLYFTDARIDTHLNQSTASANQVLSWDGSDYAWVNQSGGGGGGGNAFTNFAVSGQSTIQADSSTDTLTLVGAGLNSITTNASSDTVTIGTPTGIPFVKEDGTSTSLNMSVVAGTLSTAVASLYIPFVKDDGTSVTTLVMS
jgi:hypothetical protein